MKALGITFLVLIVLSVGGNAATLRLEKIWEIGNDTEGYTFFEPRSAAIADNGDVFISDAKGHCVSKYDKNGRLVKRVGKNGQGPGDFNLPSGIQLVNDELYVHDAMNQRIVVLDRQLNFKKYVRNSEMFMNFFFLNRDNEFVGDSIRYHPDKGRVNIVNAEKATKRSFFPYLPPGREWKNNDMLQLALISQQTMLVGTINSERTTLYTTFQKPEIPFKLYAFSLANGKELGQIGINLPIKEYTFPSCLLERPKMDMKFSVLTINAIFMMDKSIFLNMVLISWDGPRMDVKYNVLYQLDLQGNVKAALPLSEFTKFISLPKNDMLVTSTETDNGMRIGLVRVSHEK